jgi:alpha-1,4-digalacturonate transport system substrate-binding protein
MVVQRPVRSFEAHSATRRAFIRLVGLAAGGGLLAACAPPSSVPAKPAAEAPKPTAAEAAKPTAAAEAAKPTAAATAQSTTTSLRFVWFTDGPDQQAIEELITKFNAANPDTSVDLSIVPYKDLNQLLQTQATAGQAPDVARTSDPVLFRQYGLDLRPHLKDKDFSKAFLDAPQKMVTGANGEVFGFPHDFTMNGPFVNVSLFKKAGVELPGDKATWDDWVAATTKVKQSAGVPYAIAVDRSGHRLDTIVHNFGGSYFSADGKDTNVTSQQTAEAAQFFAKLHADKLSPLEVWAGGGGGYAAANDLFANGQVVLHLAGNWMVSQYDQVIGSKFEWKAVPNPGKVNYGGFPGGKWVMAFKNSKAPDKVARLMEFLGSADSMRSYVSKALFLPTRNDLVREGVPYPLRSDDMNVFLAETSKMPPSVYVDNYHTLFSPVANEMRDRITQVLIGELDVPQALDKVQAKGRELLKG